MVSFWLTTLKARTQLHLDLGDTATAAAIIGREPAFLAALAKLAQDHDEIDSVMLAEDSLGMWLQKYHGEKQRDQLEQILTSQYASDRLKAAVRQELENPTPQPPDHELLDTWESFLLFDR